MFILLAFVMGNAHFVAFGARRAIGNSPARTAKIVLLPSQRRAFGPHVRINKRVLRSGNGQRDVLKTVPCVLVSMGMRYRLGSESHAQNLPVVGA
jgi:hypothetical protein